MGGNLDENFEIPPCTLTGNFDYKDFPWGAYHLNLANPLRVVKCKETGMLYLCPRPSKVNRQLMLQGTLPTSLGEYGVSTYNYAAVDSLRSTDFEERIKRFNKIFTNSRRKVLDIGTSSGMFMEAAIREGWHAEGIEPFQDDVDTCLKKGLLVRQGIAESLPFPDNSFDLIHTSHVFEHLEDPLKAGKEAYRVLKPGGLIFIEVPNQLDNFGFRRDMLFHMVQQRKRDISSIHHLWFFGRKTLRVLLDRSGFENVVIENKFHKPFPGWRFVFSLASILMARMAFGSYIIRGYGYKPLI